MNHSRPMFPRTLLRPVLLALLASCGDAVAPDTTVNRVDLSASKLTLAPAATGQLVATPRNAKGVALSGRTVTWTVVPEGIATVNDGVILATALGTATITATVEGSSASATITVIPTQPAHLASAWRLESFDGVSVPGTYALFLDTPVGDRIVARVEIRLDSASTAMFDDATYQRRYCFSELHDGVLMFLYCWGDHGTFTLGSDVPVPLTLVSGYIQNVFTPGHVRTDGRLSLSEELWLGEARRSTVWTRR